LYLPVEVGSHCCFGVSCEYLRDFIGFRVNL
jgi:hypothetical protein